MHTKSNCRRAVETAASCESTLLFGCFSLLTSVLQICCLMMMSFDIHQHVCLFRPAHRPHLLYSRRDPRRVDRGGADGGILDGYGQGAVIGEHRHVSSAEHTSKKHSSSGCRAAEFEKKSRHIFYHFTSCSKWPRRLCQPARELARAARVPPLRCWAASPRVSPHGGAIAVHSSISNR